MEIPISMCLSLWPCVKSCPQCVGRVLQRDTALTSCVFLVVFDWLNRMQ